MGQATLKKIRLKLARDAEHPTGSNARGYEFTAPLDANGHIDPGAWKLLRDHCRVRRFWDGASNHGHLVHRPGGGWAIVYDIDGADDVEAGDLVGVHAFVPGEYVAIRDEDGDLATFQVVTVESA
jgi:hypothetical protein